MKTIYFSKNKKLQENFIDGTEREGYSVTLNIDKKIKVSEEELNEFFKRILKETAVSTFNDLRKNTILGVDPKTYSSNSLAKKYSPRDLELAAFFYETFVSGEGSCSSSFNNTFAVYNNNTNEGIFDWFASEVVEEIWDGWEKIYSEDEEDKDWFYKGEVEGIFWDELSKFLTGQKWQLHLFNSVPFSTVWEKTRFDELFLVQVAHILIFPVKGDLKALLVGELSEVNSELYDSLYDYGNLYKVFDNVKRELDRVIEEKKENYWEARRYGWYNKSRDDD